jgi:hypothetical protein
VSRADLVHLRSRHQSHVLDLAVWDALSPLFAKDAQGSKRPLIIRQQ